MKCPGQDIRYWKPGAIFDVKCPKCGHDVEFFKDDTVRKCGKCGYKFINPDIDFSCASYCQYAEQCLGTLPPELVAQKEELFKDQVAVEMKRYFRPDFKRIGYARRIARHAERIGKNEGGNLAVILAAAYLHDIGIHEAERKYGGTAPEYQEKEGPVIARSIMTRLGAKEGLIDEVCDIIGHHHHPRSEESVNFKVLYDAELIANLEERQKENPMDTDKLAEFVEKSFLTKSGRKEARNVLLG
ncbi:MAG: HD domain-containing protein [Desulfobacterales bacterium]